MNQRGFMLLSAIFLTLIVSFMAALTFQSVTFTKKDETALELTAINLANEQFAMIESLAARGKLSEVTDFNGKSELPEDFKITTHLDEQENLCKATVIVTWKNKRQEFTKFVRIINGE